MDAEDMREISWQRPFRIVPNPYVLKEKLIVGAAVAGVFTVLFWGIGWLVAGTPVARTALLLAAIGGGGALAIAVVFFLAWVVAAGNHIPAEHALSAKGAFQRRPARWYGAIFAEIAFWKTMQGDIAGRQAYGGIGAEATDGVNWADVKQVRVDRARHVIELRKGRFETVRLYAPQEPGRFKEILDAVTARVAAARC